MISTAKTLTNDIATSVEKLHVILYFVSCMICNQLFGTHHHWHQNNQLGNYQCFMEITCLVFASDFCFQNQYPVGYDSQNQKPEAGTLSSTFFSLLNFTKLTLQQYKIKYFCKNISIYLNQTN